MQVDKFANNRVFFGYVRCLFLFALTLAFIISTGSNAFAHKVYIFAWVEGETVFTESYFGSKRKVQGGLIQVFNRSKEKLLEGTTDDKGQFSFRPHKKEDLRIIINAGSGHRNEYILSADELSGIESRSSGQTETGKVLSSSPPEAQANAELIRGIVEEVLDSRLKPVIRELAKSRKEKEPGVTEILGGIGYIFGLMGLFMYFRSRKKGN